MSAELLRRETQRHFLVERIGIDHHRTRADEIFAAVEKQRHGSAFHAKRLDGQIDFEFPPAKGKFRRAKFGDAHVGEPFGFTHAHRKYRRGEGGAIERFLFTVGDAIAENYDARLGGFVAGSALQQFHQPRARILGAQTRETIRRDRLQAGAEANYPQIIIAAELLDQGLFAAIEFFFHEIEATLRQLVSGRAFGTRRKSHTLGGIDEQGQRPAQLGYPLVDQRRTEQKENQSGIDTSPNKSEKTALAERQALAQIDQLLRQQR